MGGFCTYTYCSFGKFKEEDGLPDRQIKNYGHRATAGAWGARCKAQIQCYTQIDSLRILWISYRKVLEDSASQDRYCSSLLDGESSFPGSRSLWTILIILESHVEQDDGINSFNLS